MYAMALFLNCVVLGAGIGLYTSRDLSLGEAIMKTTIGFLAGMSVGFLCETIVQKNQTVLLETHTQMNNLGTSVTKYTYLGAINGDIIGYQPPK